MDVPHIYGYWNLVKLDKGGMGIVYTGIDEQTGDEVIIKMLKVPETSPEKEQLPELYGLFKLETEIALSIEHEHILKAITHGSVKYDSYSLPYIVYPYIRTGSLQNFISKEHPWNNPAWSLPQIVDIIVQAARGLSYLHHQQPPIIHQDVKPSNFLCRHETPPSHTRRVHLLVSDFGTARWEKPFSYRTGAIGTPSYMAPEQSHGQVRHTADQYSLAITARYLLTGAAPPRALYMPPLPETFRQPPPTELNRARLKSREIDRVLLKALSEDPGERFPDILDFALALQQAIFRQEYPDQYFASTQYLPHASLQQAQAQTPGFYHAQTEQNVSSTQPFIPANDRPTMRPSGDNLAQQSELALPDIPVAPIIEHHTVDVPVRVSSPATPAARGRARPLPLFPLRELYRHALPDQPRMLAWSPDGQYLVCMFYNDAPRLVHRDGRIDQLPAALQGHLACWSPDSRYLAISMHDRNAHEATVTLWDRATLTRRPLTKPIHSDMPIDGLTWSVRGQLAIWLHSDLLFYDMLAPTSSSRFFPSRTVSLPDMTCGDIGTLRWSPDGSLLAAGAKNGALICWNADRQELGEHLPACRERIYSLSWSSDSALLTVAFTKRRVVFWNAQVRRELRTWKQLPDPPLAITVSPHPFVLAIATENSLLFGGIHEQIPSASYPGKQVVAWSDSTQLATLDALNYKTLVILQDERRDHV